MSVVRIAHWTVRARRRCLHQRLVVEGGRKGRVRRREGALLCGNAVERRKGGAEGISPVDVEREREGVECFIVGSEVECTSENGSVLNGNGRGKENGEGDTAECVGERLAVSAIDEARRDDDVASTSEPAAEEADAGMSSSLGEAVFLLAPFFCWGTAMVAMKGVVAHSAPFFVASHRLIPAGVLVVLYAIATGKRLPSTPMAWLSISLFALVDAAMFQGFLAEGLVHTSAGLGSVIIDSQPITVAVLAAAFLGEKLDGKKIAGLSLGLLGLCCLEVPQDWVAGVLSSSEKLIELKGIAGGGGGGGGGGGAFEFNAGEGYMLLAAQSMAVGTVMVRWVGKYTDPIMATGWHLFLGGIPLALLSVVYEDGLGLYSHLEGGDALALVYTSVFGCAVGYGIFFYLASRGNLTRLSSLTFTTPLFASVFGYVLLHETLSATQVAGAVITLAGVSFIV